jgi:Leucine-rich repeat (LRR) protein
LTLLEIDLNQLSGTIPSELGQLTSLQYLYLANNLTGTIPSELGELTSLLQIDLEYNNPTGTIPSEFSQLIALQYLYLGKIIEQVQFHRNSVK